jgi:DNA helicase HerA-like ATPase
MTANVEVDPPTAPTSEPSALTHLESQDGRSFVARGPGSERPLPGDYLELEGEDGILAFVEEVSDEASGTGFAATGTLIQVGGGPGPGRPTDSPWHEVPVRATRPDTVQRLLSGADSRLHLGHLAGQEAVGVALVPNRLNRHTFWCGQSGSGKTYALGVALEQILLHTRLPMVIFDPNSDFVRLSETMPGVEPRIADQLGERPVRILRRGDGPDSLRARLRTMDTAARGALLRIDPVVHRDEFNAMLRLNPAEPIADPRQLAAEMATSQDPAARSLGQRMENLGMFDWQIWALDHPAATDVIAERPAATVLDLGSLERQEEQLAIALSVLNDLWHRREERRPVLLVIDEAHNLCSPDLESLLGRAVRDRIIQIAAEGRKYGLWLLLSTQRPSKVHSGIVSQCDNLTLMRMNSPNDLTELADLFGFVPRQLLAQASRFRQGEALLAGGFVPAPTITQVAARMTVEGGIDVTVPMP